MRSYNEHRHGGGSSGKVSSNKRNVGGVNPPSAMTNKLLKSGAGIQTNVSVESGLKLHTSASAGHKKHSRI